MNKKEKLILSVIGILIIIAIMGVSYAAFNFSEKGSEVNSITTGEITMTYTESSNVINIKGALPTTDKTGKTRLNAGEYFDFTISSNIDKNTNINYEISAKKESGNTIDEKYIKLYLTKLDGEGEEEVMAPSVYNEEKDANTYTGRPSNEMSLYESNMSTTETINYRLRMYVSDEYNPQGDGGNLKFSVRINIYGKSGEKIVPLTTKQILEDNELKEEKVKMFNYTSDGKQYGKENANTSYITNGLYQTKDEDRTSYYYRGNIKNNNIEFGEYQNDYYIYKYNDRYFQNLKLCQKIKSDCSEENKVKLASRGDKMYWKIIRVNGDGTLRLIYNGTKLTKNYNSTDLSTWNFIGIGMYGQGGTNPKYTGYTYDRNTNETDALAKSEVDSWYNDTLGKTSFAKYITSGRFCSDTTGYKTWKEYGFSDSETRYAFASYDRLGQFRTSYTKK